VARYRKIEVAVWNDDRFLSLSKAQPNGQTLWIYLLCGPRTTTFPGLVVAREEVIASDLGWSVERLRVTFRELSANALVKVDWKVGLVLLVKALFDSSGCPRDTAKPANPNVLKNWALSWELIPECQLKFEYLQALKLFADSLGEAFAKAFAEAFAKALAKRMAIASPIQESGSRSQETGTGEKNSATPSASGSGLLDLGSDQKTPKRKKAALQTSESERAVVALVLQKLGEHTDTRYSGVDDHVRLIVGRLRDGLTELDLRCVIGYCAHPTGLNWVNKPDQSKYLRPETLFGPKTISRYLDSARSWYAKHYAPLERQERVA
jgi:uncharacterized phage protein (TIGR02220 family)